MVGTSLKERDRRWQNIRAEMERSGIDGLVVASDGHIMRRGSLYYVADNAPGIRYSYAFFPLKGEPVTISLDKGWVEDKRFLPQRRGWVPETEPYGSFIADIIKELNIEKGCIGIEGDIIPAPVYQGLLKELPGATFKPSNIIHELKLVKSPEEIGLVEKGVEVIEKVYEICIEYCRTGRTWNEITSELWKKFYDLGIEDIGGYTPPRSTEIIKTGDSYHYYPEPQALGGHWIQCGRLVSFGEPEKELRTAWELDMKAQELAAEKMIPGNTGADVWKAINEALKGSRYTATPRIGGGHGIGLDVVERPYLTPDDETVFKPGMVIALHPILDPLPKWFEAVADMYVISEGKPQKLSKSTPEIKIINE